MHILLHCKLGIVAHLRLIVLLLLWLRGQGGPRPKIIFNVIFVDGRQSYQMLFTGSKNKKKLKTYLFKKHELELIFNSQHSMILGS